MTVPAPINPTVSVWTRLGLTPGLVLRALWRERLRLAGLVAVATVAGVAIAFLMTPEFVSEARIMPEMSTGSGEVIKRLASVAGFSSLDMGESEGLDAVRPDLYPNVLQSTPFVLHLMEQSVTTATGARTTVGKLLAPDDGPRWFSFGLSSNPADQPRPGIAGPVQLTARQRELAEAIGERVGAKLDTRSGVITIVARMPDPYAAAAVAQLAMNYLTQYVTDYRTGKARLDLRFFSQRLTDARRRYQSAQLGVFRYNDQHKYLVMQAATMDRQRLEAELTIAQTVYTELARQFEQARLKVQERTPVFKVLEPPQVPHRRTAPKRTIIVLLAALGGLLLGVTLVLARETDLPKRLRRLVQEV